MNEDYLLSFDFSEFLRQLEEVRSSYRGLGSSIDQTLNTSSDSVKSLINDINLLSSSILNATMNMDSMYSLVNAQMRESLSILEDIERLGKGIGLGTLNITSKNEQIKDIYPSLAEDINSSDSKEAVNASAIAIEAMEMAKKALKSVEGSEKEIKEEVSKVGDTIQKEIDGAKRGVGSAIDKLMGPMSFKGGIVAGLIGAMILGIEYKQRIAAEAGEVANIFESSVDGLGNRVTRKAISWFSNFQEKAQRFFGIGRKEVQNQVSAFVEMGYETSSFMSNFNKDLGLVGSNIPTLTLALEKHFNLASGSAAKNVNSIVSEYGDTLDEAADKFYRLSFAAQQSGIGVNRFINNVMSGSQAMKQYGIDVEDVVQVVKKLTEHYESILGPGRRQFAGGLAGEALGAVAGGLGRLTPGFEMALAREMYPELSGYAPKQQFRSGLKRIASGEDEGFFIEYIKRAVEFARRETRNNMPAMIEFLRQNAGWDEQHAQALIDLAPSLKKGVEIDGATQKQLSEFRKTFKTEGQVLTDLQKNQSKLIQDMAKIGSGLLKVVTGILGTIITGLRVIGPFFRAMFSPPKEREKILNAITKGIDIQTDTILSGLDELMVGGSDLFKNLGDAFGQVSGNLGKALKWKAPVERDVSMLELAGESIGGETGEVIKNVGERNKVLIEGLMIPAAEATWKGIKDFFNGEEDEEETDAAVSTTDEHELELESQTGIPIARTGFRPSYKVEAIIKNTDLMTAINNLDVSMVYS